MGVIAQPVSNLIKGVAVKTLVTVAVIAGVYFVVQRKKDKVVKTAVAVTKAPSKTAAKAINLVTRSADKTDSGYTHRIGSEAWFRNLPDKFSPPRVTNGAWVPLPESEIRIPTDTDVPILDSIWVPAQPAPVVPQKSWYEIW